MIELPTVENILVDENRGITYKIMAYRKLDRAEMLAGVQMFMQQKKAKKHVKRGAVIKIISMIR